MSATQQARINHSHEAGFGLYALGIFIWMTFVSCCGATYALPFTPLQAQASPYVLAQQGAYVLTFFVVALASKNSAFQTAALTILWRLTVALFIGFLACLAVFELGVHPTWLTVLYGLFLGGGMTLGYMQWTALVARRPQGEIVPLVLIASLGSILSGSVLCLIPTATRILLASVVLMPISLALLKTYRARYATPDAEDTRTPREDAPASASGQHSLIPSLICAVVLTLTAPIVSTTYVGPVSSELTRNLVAQAANLLAMLILAAVMVFGKTRVTIPVAYRVLLPVLATAVLAGALLPPEQRWFVLFFSEASFCAVSLLMLLESCNISRESNLPVLFVYGMLGGFVYLARTPEALLGVYDMAAGEAVPPVMAALLLYLLAVPSFILPLLSRKQEEPAGPAKPAGPQPTGKPDMGAACETLAAHSGLTSRQTEVMKLLVTGTSTARIAQTLNLSENTVATYRKAIYSALGVHSRQELLDLVEDRTA